MHYFDFHIGDYKAHTHHLSLIEDLAYRRLLDLYYMTEKPIIGDQAARLIGMREHGHEVLCVLMEFFEETESGFINKRADQEIASYKAMSEGGKKGAQKRWDNYRNGVAITTPCPSHSIPNETLIATSNHEPVTNNQEINTLVVSKLTPCPHQEILALFAEELPELPQPRIWEGKREKDLASRWKWVLSQADKSGSQATKEYGLDFFRRMFAYVSKSDFLMGRSSNWSCDLGWIVNSGNFAKIIDGHYENKVAA